MGLHEFSHHAFEIVAVVILITSAFSSCDVIFSPRIYFSMQFSRYAFGPPFLSWPPETSPRCFRNPSRFLLLTFLSRERKVSGGLKWTRTTDLALIRRAL